MHNEDRRPSYFLYSQINEKVKINQLNRQLKELSTHIDPKYNNMPKCHEVDYEPTNLRKSMELPKKIGFIISKRSVELSYVPLHRLRAVKKEFGDTKILDKRRRNNLKTEIQKTKNSTKFYKFRKPLPMRKDTYRFF